HQREREAASLDRGSLRFTPSRPRAWHGWRSTPPRQHCDGRPWYATGEVELLAALDGLSNPSPDYVSRHTASGARDKDDICLAAIFRRLYFSIRFELACVFGGVAWMCRKLTTLVIRAVAPRRGEAPYSVPLCPARSHLVWSSVGDLVVRVLGSLLCGATPSFASLALFCLVPQHRP